MTDSRTMLITGASTGIGAQTARRAHEAGYNLAISARSEEPLRELATELGGGDDVLVQTCDVTEWAQVQALVAGPVVGSDSSRRSLAPSGDLSCRPEHLWGPLSPTLRVARTFGASVGAPRDDDS